MKGIFYSMIHNTEDIIGFSQANERISTAKPRTIQIINAVNKTPLMQDFGSQETFILEKETLEQLKTTGMLTRSASSTEVAERFIIA